MMPEPIADRRTAPAEISFISFTLTLMFGSIISQVSSIDVFINSNERTTVMQIIIILFIIFVKMRTWKQRL